jgi:hypothetical protein
MENLNGSECMEFLKDIANLEFLLDNQSVAFSNSAFSNSLILKS